MRDELEHLLDDDEDMAEMYLTDKLELQQLENSSVSSLSELDDLHEKQVVLPNEENRHVKCLCLSKGIQLLASIKIGSLLLVF